MLGCRGCGEVWERCGRVYGVSVEVVLKWGKVCWDAERCGDVGSQHTLLHLSPHPPHSPDTSSHTHLTRLSTFSHTHLPPPHTLSHFPTSLTLFLHLPNTFPHSLPILSHNPHASSNTSLCSPNFIIYPMRKFLTFLIRRQISLTIKYTRNS